MDSTTVMKIFLVALAIVLTTPFLRAQVAPEPATVSTTGTAEIKVVPDLADLSFEVEVRNADLATARKDQIDRATKVIAALRATGIAEADLQAADITIAPNYTENQRDKVEMAKVRFFTVSQRVVVTLHDVKKVPNVIASAFNAGATEMRGAELRTSELRKHRDTARSNAIKAAKEKAIALAGELGAKVGKPYRIAEQTYASYDNNRNISFNNGVQVAIAPEGDSDATGAAFAVGTISVSASVSVTFLLE